VFTTKSDKKSGGRGDELKVVLPGGNVEQGVHMMGPTIAFHSAMQQHTPRLQPSSPGPMAQIMPKTFLEFDHTKFPWKVQANKRGAIVEAGIAQEAARERGCTVEIGVKFATNITSRSHDKRRFLWRASIQMFGLDEQELLHRSGQCPAFTYLPRNPDKESKEFRLDAAVSDGRAGDLVVISGAGFDSEHRLNLVARLKGPTELRLCRLVEQTKNMFVTRIPEGTPPGEYTVQLLNADNEEEATAEIKLVLTGSVG